MKPSKWTAAIAFFLASALTVAPITKSHALFGFLVGDAVKAAIKAIDLQIQKLQNQTIVLQNTQKAVENAMSKLKLDDITAFAQKQQQLFSGYYQELLEVKSVIAGYKKVENILEMQAQMVSDYKTAYNLFKNDSRFKPEEIKYMYTVYTNLLDKSVRDLAALTVIVSSHSTQMGDGKRLEAIGKLSSDMEHNRLDLLQFNRQNTLISLNRTTSEAEAQDVKRYYGL